MTRIISLLNESEIRKIISNYENEDFETISKCLVVLKNRHNSSVGVGVIDNICKHFNKRNYDELIGNSVLSNSQSKFCSNCGGNVSDSIKFCSNCGYKIEISSDPKNSNEEIIVSGEIVNTDFKVTSFIKKEKFPTENKVVEIKIEESKIRTNYPINHSNKKEKTKWNGYKTFLFFMFIFTVYILFKEIIIPFTNSPESNENVENNSKPVCIGNQDCIDKVRSNFTSSGKQILNEFYLGDSVFKITGLDPSKGVTFNSTISTRFFSG